MKQLILMACIAGILVPMGLYPQKVYKDGEGRVILDMTVEAGMPVGAVTKDSKTEWYKSVNPDNHSLTKIDNEDNDQNHLLNDKVYQKLEISQEDPGTYTWGPAFNYCKNKVGREWRLPTQRELMMMYIFKTALNDLLATEFNSNSPKHYWSSTEYNNGFSWITNIDNGNTSNSGEKITASRVRCVREIP